MKSYNVQMNFVILINLVADMEELSTAPKATTLEGIVDIPTMSFNVRSLLESRGNRIVPFADTESIKDLHEEYSFNVDSYLGFVDIPLAIVSKAIKSINNRTANENLHCAT